MIAQNFAIELFAVFGRGIKKAALDNGAVTPFAPKRAPEGRFAASGKLGRNNKLSLQRPRGNIADLYLEKENVLIKTSQTAYVKSSRLGERLYHLIDRRTIEGPYDLDTFVSHGDYGVYHYETAESSVDFDFIFILHTRDHVCAFTFSHPKEV